MSREWNGLSLDAPCHGFDRQRTWPVRQQAGSYRPRRLQGLWHLNHRGSRASALLQWVQARLVVDVARSAWSLAAGRGQYRRCRADIVPVGAGLLAKAVVVAMRVCLTHRRSQASALLRLVQARLVVDVARSAWPFAAVFAGKRAPTNGRGSACSRRCPANNVACGGPGPIPTLPGGHYPCRSRLAGESGGRRDACLPDPPTLAGKRGSCR